MEARAILRSSRPLRPPSVFASICGGARAPRPSRVLDSPFRVHFFSWSTVRRFFPVDFPYRVCLVVPRRVLRFSVSLEKLCALTGEHPFYTAAEREHRARIRTCERADLLFPSLFLSPLSLFFLGLGAFSRACFCIYARASHLATSGN